MPRRVATFFTAPPGAIRDQLWTPEASRLAAKLGFDVRLNPRSGKLASAEWAELLADVEALITTWGAPSLDERILAGNSRLKIVGHAAGSVANLVTPYLYERGVRVTGANPVMARFVAEWCLMMTLVAARRLTDYTAFGGGVPRASRREAARSPAGLTIGIWGFGAVVRHLLEMLKPFSPRRVLVHDPYLSPEAAGRLGIERVDFDTLLGEADILHILTGLTRENLGRVDAAALGRMKPGATLINAGRAPLVEREALLEVLRTGKISAILDVHYREPVPADDPFTALPNVTMTPHCAGFPGRDRYVSFVLREFDRFFHGLPLEAEISRERALNMTDSNLLKRPGA